MCGILGFIAGSRSRFDLKDLRSLMDRLLCLSETRGKDASGLVLSDGSRIVILKRPVRGKSLIKTKDYISLLREFEKSGSAQLPETIVAMGHTRMVTNGSADIHENNQPVFKQGMLCFHNGIVVNDNEVWQKYFTGERQFEVDTEIILSMIAYYRQREQSIVAAVRSAFNHLKGANSIALLAEDMDAVILATTNGSLFIIQSASGAELIYASEKYILDRVVNHPAVKNMFKNAQVLQVKPNFGYAITLEPLQVLPFTLKDNGCRLPEVPHRKLARVTIDLKPVAQKVFASSPNSVKPSIEGLMAGEKLVAIDEKAIASLRRCTGCLLPETFPLISFDVRGLCNYCRNYQPVALNGEDELIRYLIPSVKAKGEPVCLVPLSGGRDSSYALHYLSKVLKIKSVAYTYDWGMVTDLARRNISRMCGELGIEHILISADIRQKRENIRKNVSAWLRKPDLGTIPLFMAGDKQFFYYANLLRKQMDIGPVMFSMNPLERTDFKSAFCGINENHKKKVYWELSYSNKLKIFKYYCKSIFNNTAYLNASVFDTIFAFLSYYLIPKNFALIYDYIAWDEVEINETLDRQYGWEKATDIKSTWRIGDGTAAFYNYIYYRVAGFTENDTFKSNQIRAGQITREEALARVNEDNRPRLESIRWYCDTVGIDWREALRRINTIPPLYRSISSV
jgi:glucosamine--fructose-6-phosphate aminotransferase (isomerizing)